MKQSFALAIAALLLASCNPSGEGKHAASALSIGPKTRIVSLNGTLTEIAAALGYTSNIVGVDVTSTYPDAIQRVPKLGHNRNISAEGVVALKPDIVMGSDEFMKPEQAAQFRAAGARVFVFHVGHSTDSARMLIRAMADSLGTGVDTDPLLAQISSDSAKAVALTARPKVLFIYARGAGTLMAAGAATSIDGMLAYAGAANAVTGYEGFKPLTTEALVAAQPDVILMFDSGLSSLGGIDGLLKVPGIAQTPAGKARRVVEMDGQFLTGFGPRTGLAIAELSKQLDAALRN